MCGSKPRGDTDAQALLTLAAAWAVFDAIVFGGGVYPRLEVPSATGVLCWAAVDPDILLAGPDQESEVTEGDVDL